MGTEKHPWHIQQVEKLIRTGELDNEVLKESEIHPFFETKECTEIIKEMKKVYGQVTQKLDLDSEIKIEPIENSYLGAQAYEEYVTLEAQEGILFLSQEVTDAKKGSLKIAYSLATHPIKIEDNIICGAQENLLVNAEIAPNGFCSISILKEIAEEGIQEFYKYYISPDEKPVGPIGVGTIKLVLNLIDDFLENRYHYLKEEAQSII